MSTLRSISEIREELSKKIDKLSEMSCEQRRIALTLDDSIELNVKRLIEHEAKLGKKNAVKCLEKIMLYITEDALASEVKQLYQMYLFYQVTE